MALHTTDDTLGAALEREHREIDEGLAAFAEGLKSGERRVAPLLGAMQALRRHIYLEEELLFPSLRAAGMMAPVFVMIREHGEIWRAMDEVEARLGKDGDGEALMDTCQQLAAQLESHNAKEEAILYPRADQVLAGAAGAELDAFLASGEMPADWVCAGARA
jgi:hemerythrin-like domain-containing protein